MGRRPCCSKEGMNRGAWSAREDKILTDYIKTHGEGKWRDLPKRAGLRRCGKSCRLRWLNYLRPNIKRGNISEDEEELIIRLHKLLGNRWSLIAGRLPGRTDNEIKNYWNTNLSKKVKAHADQSNKQKGLKSKSKKTTMRFINDEASPKSVEQSHPIIRTKAVRCKRVFIPPQHGDRISKPICEESPSSLVPQDVDSSNLFVDFDMEEFISSIQDDDFLQDCMNDIGYDGNIMFGDDRDNKRSPCSDHPLPNEEAMIGDWRGSDSLQVKVTSQLKTLASLLDSEEEWLEK